MVTVCGPGGHFGPVAHGVLSTCFLSLIVTPMLAAFAFFFLLRRLRSIWTIPTARRRAAPLHMTRMALTCTAFLLSVLCFVATSYSAIAIDKVEAHRTSHGPGGGGRAPPARRSRAHEAAASLSAMATATEAPSSLSPTTSSSSQSTQSSSAVHDGTVDAARILVAPPPLPATCPTSTVLTPLLTSALTCASWILSVLVLRSEAARALPPSMAHRLFWGLAALAEVLVAVGLVAAVARDQGTRGECCEALIDAGYYDNDGVGSVPPGDPGRFVCAAVSTDGVGVSAGSFAFLTGLARMLVLGALTVIALMPQETVYEAYTEHDGLYASVLSGEIPAVADGRRGHGHGHGHGRGHGHGHGNNSNMADGDKFGRVAGGGLLPDGSPGLSPRSGPAYAGSAAPGTFCSAASTICGCQNPAHNHSSHRAPTIDRDDDDYNGNDDDLEGDDDDDDDIDGTNDFESDSLLSESEKQRRRERRKRRKRQLLQKQSRAARHSSGSAAALWTICGRLPCKKSAEASAFRETLGQRTRIRVLPMFPKTAREPQGRCCGWNGTPVFSPKGWLAPSSDAELCHAIDSVHGWGFRLRAVGSGRACSAGGGTSGYVMDTSGLQQPLEVDQRALTITVEAGMTLGHLCDLARENGMALASFGGQRARTVGGALALGSGSGPSLRHMPLHDCAVELVIVSPSGQRITVHEPASGANRVPIGRDGSRPTASLAAAIPGYGYDLSASPVSGGGGRGGGHGGGAGGGHGGAASVPGATTVLSASMASGSSPNSVSSFASSFASHSTATSGAESKTSGSSALPPLKPIAQSSFDDSGTHVAWIHHNTGNNNNNNNNNSDDDPERAERHRQQYVAQQQQQQQQQQYQHHHHHQQPQSLLPSSAGLSSDSNSTTLGGMTVEPAIPPPPDAFEERDHAAAILSLGRLGVIYSVTLRCVPRYSVAFRTESQPLSVTLHALAATAVRHEFVRFAWWPHTQIATVTTGHAVSPDKGAPGGKGAAARMRTVRERSRAVRVKITRALVRGTPERVPGLLRAHASALRSAPPVYGSAPPEEILWEDEEEDAPDGSSAPLAAWMVPFGLAAPAVDAMRRVIEDGLRSGSYVAHEPVRVSFRGGGSALLCPTRGVGSAEISIRDAVGGGLGWDWFVANCHDALVGLGAVPTWSSIGVTDNVARYGARGAAFNTVAEIADPTGMFVW